MSGCLGRKSGVFDPFRFSLCIRRESAVSAMLYITVMAAPSPSLDNNLYFPTFFWAFSGSALNSSCIRRNTYIFDL